jgi:hypothetical protein
LLLKWIDAIGTIEFSVKEVHKFNRLYPQDIRKEIKEDIERNNLSTYTIIEAVNEIFDCIDVTA